MKKPPQKSNWKLPKETAQVLSYWRDSLVEGEREEISGRDLKKLGAFGEADDAARGRTSPSVFQTLLEKSKDQSSSYSTLAKQKDGSRLAVLVCPLRFKRIGNDSGPAYIEAFWIPAILDELGKFYPPDFGAPWIPRELLEPQVSDDSPTIGDLSDLDEFSRSAESRNWSDWASYFRHASELFKAVTGKAIEKFTIENYERIPSSAILVDTSSHGTYRSHISFSEFVSQGKEPPGLLPKLARISESKLEQFSNSLLTASRSAVKHSGQFSDKFSLAPSQRRAVHRFFETDENDLLCVNGPPGTGKTTVIQSIVASLWVNAAVENKLPPLIVCCGATNQSVTNILDSFEQTQGKPNRFSGRWLPEVHSYGRYCCSEAKVSEAGSYQIETRKQGGLAANMASEAYLSDATGYFLDKYRTATKHGTSLEDAARQLRNEIQKQHRKLRTKLRSTADFGFLDSLFSLFGISSSRSADDFLPNLAVFDTAERFHLFLLSTHYWEAQWLLEAKRKLRFKELQDQGKRRDVGPAEWRHRAMVTPAFVSTLAMFPKFFRQPRSTEPPVDLLVFDEASQVPSELGAICSALTKKLVVIGDERQLAPVYNVQPQVDRLNAVKHGLAKSGDLSRFEKLSKRGILASTGSFMRLALRSSSKIDQSSGRSSTIGVLLSEHRRSVPTLIAFCNELAYNGRLEPLRPELETRILPSFGYVHVEGQSEVSGSSRCNPREAAQLVAWLTANQSAILEFYRAKDLSDVVAVISPFAAQIARLKRTLRKTYTNMIVGTVHSLQGAERPIVLFSTVYDRSNTARLALDRDVNLLNVAVSRAKDSFIVFGDTEIFQPQLRTPSGILGKHLFAVPENELSPAEDHQLGDIPESETERITTLEGHSRVLREAFETARSELIIVSPTISKAAILHDRIPELISEARRRGVSVIVYTDTELDTDDQGVKPRAVEGRKLLTDAGATLRVVRRIHSKQIAVDNHTIVEGSFNWLSANRNPTSSHQKYETSTLHRGKSVAKAIEALKAEMEYRGQ